MQPKRSQAYYGLTSEGKVCYHNGMPIRQCQSETSGILFRTEKVGEQLIQTTDQKKIFDIFRKHIPADPQVSLFCSSNTDEDALEAASLLLRGYVKSGWASFQFVNQDDVPPYDAELVKDLYILMGVHQDDPCGWVRRWVRGRLGVPIWICLTAPKPVDWYQTRLGIKPDFLFSVKNTARAAG